MTEERDYARVIVWMENKTTGEISEVEIHTGQVEVVADLGVMDLEEVPPEHATTDSVTVTVTAHRDPEHPERPLAVVHLADPTLTLRADR